MLRNLNHWYDSLAEPKRFAVFVLLCFPWIIAGAFYAPAYLPLLPLLLVRMWWIHFA